MTAWPNGLHIFKALVIYCHQWCVWVFVYSLLPTGILILTLLGNLWSQWRIVNVAGYDIDALRSCWFVYVELFILIPNCFHWPHFPSIYKFLISIISFLLFASVSILAENKALLVNGLCVLCGEANALFRKYKLRVSKMGPRVSPESKTWEL